MLWGESQYADFESLGSLDRHSRILISMAAQHLEFIEQMEEVTLQSEEDERDIKIDNLHDFLKGIKILLKDETFPEENINTTSFIEAMHAWLEAFDGRNNLFEEPNDKYITWSDLYKLLQAAAIYE